MSEPLIPLEQHDSVAWITINRPKAFNALNLPAMQELFEIANRISSDKSVRTTSAIVEHRADKTNRFAAINICQILRHVMSLTCTLVNVPGK